MLNPASILSFFPINRTPVFDTVLPKTEDHFPATLAVGYYDVTSLRDLGEACLKGATFTPPFGLKLPSGGWSCGSQPVLKMTWGWKPCARMVEQSVTCRWHCRAVIAALDYLLWDLFFFIKEKLPFCLKCCYFVLFFDMQFNLVLTNTVANDLCLVQDCSLLPRSIQFLSSDNDN